MNEVTKKSIFPFLATNTRAAEAFLNAQAAEGWAFTGFSALGFLGLPSLLGRAKFRYREDAPPRKYAVALYAPPTRIEQEEGETPFDRFVRVQGERGWALVDSAGAMHVFSADPDADEFPPDDAAEARYVANTSFARLFVVAAAIFVLRLAWDQTSFFAALGSNGFLAALIAGGAVAVFTLARAVRYLRVRRRQKQGSAAPPPDVERALAEGVATRLGAAALALLALGGAAADLLVDPGNATPLFQALTLVFSAPAINYSRRRSAKVVRALLFAAAFACVILAAYSRDWSRQNLSASQLSGLPVLSGTLQAEGNSLRQARSPLLLSCHYEEYGEDGGRYTVVQSWYYEASAQPLADALFRSLAKDVDGAKAFDFPGADRAVLHESGTLAVVQRGARVARIADNRGFTILEPDRQQQIRAAFFE